MEAVVDETHRYTFYTSFLFVIIVYLATGFLRALFLVLTPVSVLYHAKYYDEYQGKQVVKVVDKALCWLAIAHTLHLSIQVESISHHLVLYWLCLGFIVAVYCTTDSWRVHEAIHIACVVGISSLCCIL